MCSTIKPLALKSTPATSKPLNPQAAVFASSSSDQESASSSPCARSPPGGCGSLCPESGGASPKSPLLLQPGQQLQQLDSGEDGMLNQELRRLPPLSTQALPDGIQVAALDLRPSSSSSNRETIPGPSGVVPMQRQHSGSLRGPFRGGSPPPLPVHPGLVPHFPHYGAPYPIYPYVTEPLERSASPPAMYPGGGSPPVVFNGGSPPLPSGFVSVPVLTERGSPIPPHMQGSSPSHHFHPHPAFGSSPPGYSPPMPGSPPPGMVFHAVPYPMPHPGAGSHDYNAPHGYSPQQPQLQPEELLQRMAGLGLSSQQQQQQQERQPNTGRSEGRASARIARSHRAGGAYNASEFVFNVEDAEAGNGRTTLMIRNIPNKYTQEQMLSVLQNAGFTGTHDFFYLPVDFRNKCNLGYCFVNFTTSQVTARLFREFHQKRWDELSSRKVCEVSYARVQGLTALTEHFRTAKFPSFDSDLQPLVFTKREGDVASDPVPLYQYIAAQDGATKESEQDQVQQHSIDAEAQQ